MKLTKCTYNPSPLKLLCLLKKFNPLTVPNDTYNFSQDKIDYLVKEVVVPQTSITLANVRTITSQIYSVHRHFVYERKYMQRRKFSNF